METTQEQETQQQQTTTASYTPSPTAIALYEAVRGGSSSGSLTRSEDVVQVLTKKILNAKEKANEVHSYRCIQQFRFVEPRCALHPTYARLLEQKDRVSRRIALDVGCCMGTDLRKMLIDGFIDPSRGDSIIGVDIAPDFFQIGFEIFEDEDQIRDKLFPCDLLQPHQCAQLRALRGPFNLVYCGSVFHLMERENTEILARAIFGLMENGIFFGRTGGKTPGFENSGSSGFQNSGTYGDGSSSAGTWAGRFLHTRESLKEMLERVGFQDIIIELTESDMSPDRNMFSFQAEKREH